MNNVQAIVAWIIFRPRMTHHYRVKVAAVVLPKRGAAHEAWKQADEALTEEKSKLVSEGYEVLGCRVGREHVLGAL